MGSLQKSVQGSIVRLCSEMVALGHVRLLRIESGYAILVLQSCVLVKIERACAPKPALATLAVRLDEDISREDDPSTLVGFVRENELYTGADITQEIQRQGFRCL